jgi:uncharacterized membrane protein
MISTERQHGDQARRPHDKLEAPHTPKSRQVELLISNLLRIGVLSSLSLVVLGVVVSYVHHRDYFTQPPALQHLTAPGAAFPHSLRDVWRGLLAFRGQAIVTLGLMLLIATPVMRVAVSILGFLYERDRAYVVITTIVLLLLILSFVLGAVERT